MKTLKNILSIVALVFAFSMSNNVTAQTDCIQLPPELKDLIKIPTKKEDLNKSMRTSQVFSDQSGAVDFLVEFNKSFKNHSKLSKSDHTYYNNVLTELKKDLSKNAVYNDMQSMVSTSRSVSEVRSKIQNKINSTRNNDYLQAYILFDYQLQILSAHNVFVPKGGLQSIKGGPNAVDFEFDQDGWDAMWDIFMGAAAGATIAGAAGAAGCTVVLPIVGTVACGVVGAVGGAIVGAVYTIFK